MDNYYDNGDTTASLIGLLVQLAFYAAYYVYFGITIGKIFQKAGIESWKAWVPVYNNWVFLELGKQAGWLILLSFIPFVGPLITFIFMVIAAHEINKGFGKGTGFTVLYFFLPFVWSGILAWGSSRYNEIESYSEQGYVNTNPYLTNQPGYQQPYSQPYGQPQPPAAPGYPVPPAPPQS